MQRQHNRVIAARSGPANRKRPRGNVRWVVLAVGALGLAIAYLDRSALSVAMPGISAEISIDPALQGVILSSFFWTYALFQLPAGWLTDRFGPKLVYAVAVVWWSVFTAAVALTRGVGSLIGVRMALGIGEAPVVPANIKLVSAWFPRRERAFASSLVDTGQQLGSTVALPVMAALIALFGWRWSFVVIGVAGALWVVLWRWGYHSPRAHPTLSAEEREYIEDGGLPPEPEPSTAIRWRHLLRYPTVWGMILGYVCRGVVVYFFLTWYPSYLVDEQGFGLLEVGLYGTVPPLLALFAGWIGGWFSDHLVRRGHSLGVARKIPIVGALLGATTIAGATTTDDIVLVMLFLTLANCAASFASGPVLALPTDIAPAPSTVASLASLQNFGAQVGGIGGPIMIGLIVQSTGSYTPALLTAAVLCVVGALIYAFVVKIEPLRTPEEGRTHGS